MKNVSLNVTILKILAKNIGQVELMKEGFLRKTVGGEK